MTLQPSQHQAPVGRAQAEDAVTRALQEALKTSSPVTFARIADAAGVSREFIYRHPELRAQIDALRRNGRSTGDAVETENPFAAESTVIVRLSQQLVALRRQHRRETTELRRELAAAHGELIYLRERLNAES